jgi:PAS domain S-box-containing protein
VQFLGVLNVSDPVRTFTSADAALLSLLALQAAIAIQNARLYAETHQRLQEQIALREATNLISASLDLKTVLGRIAEQMGRAVDASSAYLCSVEAQTRASIVLAEYFGPRAADKERISDLGLIYNLPRDFTHNLDSLLAGYPEQVHLDSLPANSFKGSHMRRFGAQTILNIPLQVRGQTIAFAELWESQWPRKFTAEELSLCQALAQQAAIAIEHARLYTEARESEEKYRTVVNNVKEVIFQIDIVGRWTFLNPAWTEITGFTLEESLGQNLLDFIHPDDQRHVETAFQLPFEEAIYYQHEARYLTKTGSFRWLDFRAWPVWSERTHLLGAYGTLNDITERKQAEDQLLAALGEKEVLLKEIHHRVKNNLQVISSLLDLQSDHVRDPQAGKAFENSRSRIRSLSLIHEHLYQSKNLAQIDFGDYMRHLFDDLLRSYQHPAATITTQVNVTGSGGSGGVWLDVQTAVLCGLIINELISNALKHAFPDGRAGQICLDLHAENNGLVLQVSDNGVGLPEEVDFQQAESLGLQLVNMLAHQLKGTIELERKEGATFKLYFTGSQNRKGGLHDSQYPDHDR